MAHAPMMGSYGLVNNRVILGSHAHRQARASMAGTRIRDRKVLADLREKAIRRKRPGLLRRGVVLQHDNATPHSANFTQQWLQRYGWEILPHPAHNPDLAPSDSHLFGPLKRHLGGMAFETEDTSSVN
ncbi:histone-lysine N-methyltransferase SETMAR [Plakobranchus ocellatus]|uniref:Histone-lysine N-methyltransferase SETMAR n=1 Tax=Plakobranchus ocellatus TaxID=259542 RepID=A0AAV3XVU7_9GAST|nr:histone-lysine N-methyltransferase SETMAR [Plakobranchus ocellatus]